MMKINKNITLIGMPGAGKTVIAKEISKLIDATVIDADDEICTAAGRPITDIFTDFGEQEFRNGERRVIKRLLQDKQIILSAGGGAYINPETRKVIDENSISIWLDVDFSTLWHRIKGKKHRPMLCGHDAKSKLKSMYKERTPIYAQAQISVKHEKQNAHYMAKKIVGVLQKHLNQQ